ncbi:MAG: hypothetical protein GY698_16735, partial [Actinomycetia bacterium]|nr:hypothetical protein [Actinomycetes bacterium]
LERDYQTRAQSGAGGEVERAPNAQTFAVQQVREEDPAAVEAASFAQMGEALSTILGPGA